MSSAVSPGMTSAWLTNLFAPERRLAGWSYVQDPDRLQPESDPELSPSKSRETLGWVVLAASALIGAAIGAAIGATIPTTSIMMTSLESSINALLGAAIGTGMGLVIGLALRSGLR